MTYVLEGHLKTNLGRREKCTYLQYAGDLGTRGTRVEVKEGIEGG